MNKVTIKSVKLEGFGSYALPQVFKFDTRGLYCVSGPNGAGKSTLFTALYWVLYNKTMKDWSNANIQSFKRLRTKEYKGTRVQVSFEVGKYKYMAIRHLSYKGLTYGVEGGDTFMVLCKPKEVKEAFTDADMVNDELYKADQKGYIERLLGIDDKTFINSIIFGQKMNRLIGAKPDEKRKLFENLFEIDFVDLAKANADAKKAEIEANIAKLNNSVAILDSKMQGKASTLQLRLESVANFKKEKAERLDTITKEYDISALQYDNLNARLEVLREKAAKTKKSKGKEVDLDALLTKADNAKEQKDKIERQIHEINLSVQTIDRQIAQTYNDQVTISAQIRDMKSTCSACGQKLNPKALETLNANLTQQHKQKEKERSDLQHHRGKVAGALPKLGAAYIELKTEFDEAFDAWNTAKLAVRATVNTDDSEMNRIEGQLEAIEESLAKIKARYKTEKKKEAPEVDTTELEAEISDLKVKIAGDLLTIQQQQEELDRVMWWIKKGFGATGLKPYIFSAMLEQLNEYAAKYSVYFGFGVRFWVDLNMASKRFMTTVYHDKEEDPYENLSGGQQQRVDVCLAFAMYDLVSYKTKFNILVLDEVTDGLDGEGVEMLNSIITEAAETKAVYIISHNPIFVPPSASTILIEGGLKEASTIVI